MIMPFGVDELCIYSAGLILIIQESMIPLSIGIIYTNLCVPTFRLHFVCAYSCSLRFVFGITKLIDAVHHASS